MSTSSDYYGDYSSSYNKTPTTTPTQNYYPSNTEVTPTYPTYTPTAPTTTPTESPTSSPDDGGVYITQPAQTFSDQTPQGDRKYEIRFIGEKDLADLGLDASWEGLPMAVGYYDQNNVWHTTADKMDVARQMHDLRNLERPEMIDLLNSDAYNNLVDLTAQLESGELVAADQAAGQAYFEELMGFTPGGYTQRLSAMEGLLEGGIAGQQGLTPEQRDIYNRQTQTQLQMMRNESAQLMESLGASGRSVTGFQAMLSLSRQQADFQSQRDLELLTQDLMMKQAEYDALSNRYEQLFNMGQITIGQYSSALRENRMAAIQSYAQQITVMSQQNQTNLAAYETHANVMYQNLMADLGVSKGLLDEAAAHYEMYMAPVKAEQERQALENQQAALEAQDTANALSTATNLVATGASIGTALGNPVIGAAIGGGLGLIVMAGDFFGWW